MKKFIRILGYAYAVFFLFMIVKDYQSGDMNRVAVDFGILVFALVVSFVDAKYFAKK